MKYASIFAITACLSLPAFAESNKTTLYGDINDSDLYGTLASTDTIEQNTKNVYDSPDVSPDKSTYTKPVNSDIKFPHGMQLGLGVSVTGGLDGFIGYNNKKFDSFWWKRFGVRLGYASYSPIKNKLNSRINSYIGDDGIEIDDNLKLNNLNMNAKHIGALIDFYPFGDTWFLGGWRISGGYMNGNLNLNADILGTKKIGSIEFELGDRKYSYDGSEMHGKATLKWKYNGPYLGTGFDLGLFYGFKIYMDAGVVFTDNHAKIDLFVPLDGLKDITDNPNVPQEITGTVRQEYDKAKTKALSDAQKELNKVDYYPIVKLGFMYRF